MLVTPNPSNVTHPSGSLRAVLHFARMTHLQQTYHFVKKQQTHQIIKPFNYLLLIFRMSELAELLSLNVISGYYFHRFVLTESSIAYELIK